MRKNWWIIAIVGIFIVGCGSSEATATKQEEQYFRNPDKTPPPEAGGPPRDGRATSNPGAPPGATGDPRTMGPPPGAEKGPETK